MGVNVQVINQTKSIHTHHADELFQMVHVSESHPFLYKRYLHLLQQKSRDLRAVSF